jgi:hypothetical protein
MLEKKPRLFAGIAPVVCQAGTPKVPVPVVANFEAVVIKEPDVDAIHKIDPEGDLRAVGWRLLEDGERARVEAFVEALDKLGLVDRVADEVTSEESPCPQC